MQVVSATPPCSPPASPPLPFSPKSSLRRRGAQTQADVVQMKPVERILPGLCSRALLPSGDVPRAHIAPSRSGSSTPSSPTSSTRASLSGMGDLRITVKNTFIDVEEVGEQANQEDDLYQRGARSCAARFSTCATPKFIPCQSFWNDTPVAGDAIPSPPIAPPPFAEPEGGSDEGEEATPPGVEHKAGTRGNPKVQVQLQVPLEVNPEVAKLLSEVPNFLRVQLAGTSIDHNTGGVVLDVRMVLAANRGMPAAQAGAATAPGIETPQSGSSQGSPGRRRLVCCHWKNKGWCRYQDNCKFLHPPHKRGIGASGAKTSRGAMISPASFAHCQ